MVVPGSFRLVRLSHVDAAKPVAASNVTHGAKHVRKLAIRSELMIHYTSPVWGLTNIGAGPSEGRVSRL